jgi:hypothetical protein
MKVKYIPVLGNILPSMSLMAMVETYCFEIKKKLNTHEVYKPATESDFLGAL